MGPDSDTLSTLSNLAPIPDTDTFRRLLRAFHFRSGSASDVPRATGSKLIHFFRQASESQQALRPVSFRPSTDASWVR